MKKLLLIASAVVLSISCSSSDDASNNNISRITPPTWIHGTWINLEIYNDTGYKIGYKFTTDDLCILSNSSENCWKKLVDDSNTVNYPYPMNVEQTISETEYTCSITQASQTNHYQFRKVSSKTIEILNDGTILTKIQ